MQHAADRAAILAALKESLGRYDAWGLERPTNSSMREYLGALAEVGVAPRDAAENAAKFYECFRFGSASAPVDEVTAVIASLESAAAELETLEEEQRAVLAERLRERLAPRHPPLASPPSPPWQNTPTLPPLRRSDEAPCSLVLEARRRKMQAERGPSRLWTFMAVALAMWTLMVMAGSIWQQKRIENALTHTDWGRPILASLRGYEHARPLLRDRILRERRMATPSNFLRLAREHVERREYAEAIYAYQQGLVRCRENSPEKSMLLNNLAWLLLTVEDPVYRDAVQAAELAEECVDIACAPEFLDTQALAYFQNGRFQDAVTVQEETVRRATQTGVDSAVYKQRLRHFRRALIAMSDTDASS